MMTNSDDDDRVDRPFKLFEDKYASKLTDKQVVLLNSIADLAFSEIQCMKYVGYFFLGKDLPSIESGFRNRLLDILLNEFKEHRVDLTQ